MKSIKKYNPNWRAEMDELNIRLAIAKRGRHVLASPSDAYRRVITGQIVNVAKHTFVRTGSGGARRA